MLRFGGFDDSSWLKICSDYLIPQLEIAHHLPAIRGWDWSENAQTLISQKTCVFSAIFRITARRKGFDASAAGEVDATKAHIITARERSRQSSVTAVLVDGRVDLAGLALFRRDAGHNRSRDAFADRLSRLVLICEAGPVRADIDLAAFGPSVEPGRPQSVENTYKGGQFGLAAALASRDHHIVMEQ